MSETDCTYCAYENADKSDSTNPYGYCHYFNTYIASASDSRSARRNQSGCSGFVLLNDMRQSWERRFSQQYTGRISSSEFR